MVNKMFDCGQNFRRQIESNKHQSVRINRPGGMNLCRVIKFCNSKSGNVDLKRTFRLDKSENLSDQESGCN